MIHLDTSVLIDALTAPHRNAAALRRAIERGDRLAISTVVLYEWLRGPRRPAELHAQEQLFPSDQAVRFDAEAAARAADLYRAVRHPRGREIDIAIAACAIGQGASFWTLNPSDFRDIPGLTLAEP